MSLYVLNTTVLFYSVFIFLRVNFLQLRSFESVHDTLVGYSVRVNPTSSKLYELLLIGFAGALVLTHPYVISGSSFGSTHSQHIITLVIIACLLVWIFRACCFSEVSEVWPLTTVMFILGASLLWANSLVHLYLLLELVAYTNLTLLTYYGLTNAASRSNKNVTTLLISFMVNFLTSIVLFLWVLAVQWDVSYPTFDVLLWCDSAVISLVGTLAILIKFGTGPWLLGNVVGYQGYSVYYLLPYTVISLATTTPALYYLLTCIQFLPAVLLSVVLTTLFISNGFAQVTAVKSLFAYSTVIFHLYLLLLLFV